MELHQKLKNLKLSQISETENKKERFGLQYKIYIDKSGKVINRGKQKLERAAKLQKKADAAQLLITQRLANQSNSFNLDNLTDDEKAIKFIVTFP